MSQHAGSERKEISLRSRTRSLLFLITIICLSSLVAAEAILCWAVSSFVAPGVGRWLAPLDGNDPRFEYQLGEAYLASDPLESVRHFQRATQLSPLNRVYWEELESACESANDLKCVEKAGERLVELCPMVPSYQWAAARACLKINQLDAALKHIRRLLELDPTYAGEAWSSLRKVPCSPERVYEKVLAGNTDAEVKVDYVDFLNNRGDDDDAYRIWRRVVADSRPVAFASVEPFLDSLIGSSRIDRALDVWQDLVQLGIVKRPEPTEETNLVFNGDFEQEPLDAGFDWRTGQTTYLAVDFSAREAFQGARCLRVDFTVKRNEEYEPVYQIVPVLPRHAYTLKAFVRSEGITSNSGPCLRVADVQQSGFPEVHTETTEGTTPWHRIQASFSTGPQTRAVRISFWRPLGVVFPPQISGAFWLDAVSLECLGPDNSGGLNPQRAGSGREADAR